MFYYDYGTSSPDYLWKCTNINRSQKFAIIILLTYAYVCGLGEKVFSKHGAEFQFGSLHGDARWRGHRVGISRLVCKLRLLTKNLAHYQDYALRMTMAGIFTPSHPHLLGKVGRVVATRRRHIGFPARICR